MPQSKRIGIVGAGIAGLSAAYCLKKAGHEVTVYEKNEHPGGRMSTRGGPDLPFDVGADFLIDGWYSLLQSYATELGVEWKRSQEGSRPRVIRGGVPYYIDIIGPRQILGFKLLSFRARIAFLVFLAKLRLAKQKLNFFDQSANPPTLDLQSSAEYMRTQVHPEVFDYIGDPFVSIMQFHRGDEISATMLFSFMQSMTDASHSFRVAYTPGGMGMIPRALAKKVGVRYGVDVVSVAAHGSRVEVVHGRGTEVYDAVIVATTGDIAENVLKTTNPSMRKMFGTLRYAPTMTVGFTVPSDLFSDNAHLTYVPFVENEVISGYDNTVRKDAGASRDSRSVLNVYLHEVAARKFVELKDSEIFSRVQDELLRVCPEARTRVSEVQPFDLKRWGSAMPKFTGEYIGTVRKFLEEGQGAHNIYLAGDYLNSPWTEGAARCGKRVAEAIERQANG